MASYQCNQTLLKSQDPKFISKDADYTLDGT